MEETLPVETDAVMEPEIPAEETLPAEELPAEQESVLASETLSGSDSETLEGESVPQTSAPVLETVVVHEVTSVDLENLTINISEGITITGLPTEPETEEGVEYLADAVADALDVYAVSGSPLRLVVPDNRVLYYLGETQLVFPSSYVDDLSLIDGYLVNFASPVTISADLSGTASVTNYLVSQITFPTYGSSDYITYISSYGSPYRIVDRYRDGSTIRSYTRTSSQAMTSQDITQPPWYSIYGGRMYGYLFALIIIILLLWGRLRWKA